MHRLLWQHAVLKELNIAVGISRHYSILCSWGLVFLSLPIPEDFQWLVLNNSARELKDTTQ